MRLLTIKNNSHTDLRTSHAHLSGKGCHYREEDHENKILSYLQAECVGKPIAMLKLVNCLGMNEDNQLLLSLSNQN